MIRALRRLLNKRYARGGIVHSGAADYQPAGIIHHGEYIYRDADGTVWHVQQHPDGDTRTQLHPEEEA